MKALLLSQVPGWQAETPAPRFQEKNTY